MPIRIFEFYYAGMPAIGTYPVVAIKTGLGGTKLVDKHGVECDYGYVYNKIKPNSQFDLSTKRNAIRQLRKAWPNLPKKLNFQDRSVGRRLWLEVAV